MRRRAGVGWLLLVLLAVAGQAACKAGDPPHMLLDQGPDDGAIQLDVPSGCPLPPTLVAPEIEPLALSPTPHAKEAFFGRAPGAAFVVAQGGFGVSAPVSVGTDGSFCLEVDLIEDAPNTLKFVGLDSRGCPGNATTINVVHASNKVADGGASGLQNVAARLVPTAVAGQPTSGALANATDGNDSTTTELSFWEPGDTDCNKFVWLRIDLGKVYTISRIRIRWPAGVGGTYARCYAVVASNNPAAGPPDPASTDWHLVVDEQNGDATTQTKDFNPRSAQTLGFLFYEDGRDVNPYDTFTIGEIEVYGRDPDSSPPPPYRGCQR